MSINFQNDSRINIDDKKKLKPEIEDLQKQLIESIEQDNNNKLKIKDLEIKNSELEKKNFEFQSKLQDLIIKQNLIQQEDANLKLEVKKLQLSVNSPGKVLASLGNVIKGDSKNINNEILLKEKIEMKETNEKLLLVISERESEIIKNKTISEKQLSSLKDKITELNAKINDSNNDLKDMQEQLKEKDKEIQKIEEGKNILSKYNLLKFEFEQYKKKAEKNKEINDIVREKTKEIENINKNLNQRVIKLESNFNELIKKGTIQVHDMNDLRMYVEINENLRSQIMEMQDKSDKLDKKFEESMKNSEEENKKLEEKYLEQYNQAVELQKNIDYLQESFVQGTVKLNTELSQLKSKVFEVENEKRLQEEKYKELLQNYEKAGDNFVNIQKTMTKLREKDDFDITLIEERYIVLENMLDLEKNDLITQNRELINQIKLYNENESVSSKSNVKIDKNNNYQNEIKNLRDENKLLQNKLKDKENTIFHLQQKLETFKILQQIYINQKGFSDKFERLSQISDKWSIGYKEQGDFFLKELRYFFKFMENELTDSLKVYEDFRLSRNIYLDRFNKMKKNKNSTKDDFLNLDALHKYYGYYLTTYLNEYNNLNKRHEERMNYQFINYCNDSDIFIQDYNTFISLLNFNN